MKRLFLTMAILFAPFVANAQSVAGAAAGSQSSSAAGAQAGAVSLGIAQGGHGGHGGAGVGYGGSASANNAGNTQAIQFNTEAVDLGDAVPDTYAPALTTTLSGTCYGSVSGGIGVSGFGISGGSTYEDKECQARLNANALNALGLSGLAVEVLCSLDSVVEADARMGASGGKSICTANAVTVDNEPTAMGWSNPEALALTVSNPGYLTIDEIWGIDETAPVNTFEARK